MVQDLGLDGRGVRGAGRGTRRGHDVERDLGVARENRGSCNRPGRSIGKLRPAHSATATGKVRQIHRRRF